MNGMKKRSTRNKRRCSLIYLGCSRLFYFAGRRAQGMEKVKHTESTIEVFENDIDLYLHQFQEEQNIEDFKQVGQSVWNGALRYIYNHVFKNNNDLLKEHNNYTVNNNIIPNTNCNMYNYDLVNDILDYYIYLCQIYNKEISIIGFSNLTGINTDTINEWGNNSNKLSTTSFAIYKKLSQMREESLSNKLVDGKQNPVGTIAVLNRQFGWASPYTSDANRNKPRLNDNEIADVLHNSLNIRQNAQHEIEQKTD